MNAISFVYAFLLFFLLTPGILVVLPKKGKTLVVAGVHAVIFSLVFVLTNPWLVKNTYFMSEGFKEGAKKGKHKQKQKLKKDNKMLNAKEAEMDKKAGKKTNVARK